MTTPLTPYEQKQVREIAGWKAEPPALIAEAMDALAHPLVKLAERFIPERAVNDAIQIAYRDAEILAHREDIALRAGVADVRELRHGDLTRCDRLADVFGKQAARQAAIRGSAIGAGPVLSMEISVMFALKTAHTIGYCYGFTPEEPREKQYVLQTLLVASAGSLKEKEKAIVNLRSIEDVLIEDIVENVIEEQLDKLAGQIMEQAAGGTIPLLGFATQAVTNAAITYHTGRVAKRVFQERWLRANGKVDQIAPDPRLARSRLERARVVLAGCCYWPSYWASFAAAYPVLFAASFLPQQNVAVRGLADGAADASQDLQSLKDRLRQAVTTRGDSEPQLAALPAPA